MSNLKNVLVYPALDVWFGYVYKFVFRGLERNIFGDSIMYVRGRYFIN